MYMGPITQYSTVEIAYGELKIYCYSVFHRHTSPLFWSTEDITRIFQRLVSLTTAMQGSGLFVASNADDLDVGHKMVSTNVSTFSARHIILCKQAHMTDATSFYKCA